MFPRAPHIAHRIFCQHALEKFGVVGFSTQLKCINSRMVCTEYHSSKCFLNALKKLRKSGIFVRAARQICLGSLSQVAAAAGIGWSIMWVYNVPSLMMALQNKFKKFFICTAPSKISFVMVACGEKQRMFVSALSFTALMFLEHLKLLRGTWGGFQN